MSHFLVSTDPALLDLPLIHHFLSTETTWAAGITLDVVERSLRHSLCFGGYLDGRQIAFARVISDYATFANLVDVFVLPGHRGRGYGKHLLDQLFAHPDLQNLRRFTLATSSAAGLYARFGFATPSRPASLMERYRPDVYRASAASGRAA